MFAVHQPDGEELEAPFEGQFFECHGTSVEAVNSNTICVAVHVLLPFSSLVIIICTGI